VAGDPQRTGLSLIMVAPDVWAPIIINVEDPFAFDEIATDSVAREFYERRPDRKYLVEILALDKLALFSGLGEWVSFSERRLDAHNIRFVDTRNELFEIVDENGDALNTGWGVIDAKNNIMAITEAKYASVNYREALAEARAILESSISKVIGSIESGSESVPAQEAALDVVSFFSRGTESIPVSELRLDGLEGTDTQLDPLSWVERGSDGFTSRYSDQLPEQYDMVESQSEKIGLYERRPEVSGVVEVKADYVEVFVRLSELIASTESRIDVVSVFNVRTETPVFVDLVRDNLGYIGESNLSEYPAFTEAATVLAAFFAYRVEPYSLAESIVSSLNLPSVGTEVSTVTEARTSLLSLLNPLTENLDIPWNEYSLDYFRHNFTDPRTESLATWTEVKTDVVAWAGLVPEPLTITEFRQDAASTTGNFVEARTEQLSTYWTETPVVGSAFIEAKTEKITFSYPEDAYVANSTDHLTELIRLSGNPPEPLTQLQIAELILEENPMPGNVVVMTSVTATTNVARIDPNGVWISGRIRVRVTNTGSQTVYVGNTTSALTNGEPIDAQGGMWEQYWTESVPIYLVSVGGSQTCILTQTAVQ
jgi:hypothetical protein